MFRKTNAKSTFENFYLQNVLKYKNRLFGKIRLFGHVRVK
jgi:hypothetical protein